MHDLKMTNNKPFKKSARIVGEVLGSYHAHGDRSVYDAMVRLAQPFSLNYPVVDSHGNFGSIDGDPAAHYRYTEARLSKIGEEMLQDINKDTVDWKPNFSEDKEEPIVLPSRLPQLLINGTTGIAVGMACSFVPHNLGKTVDTIEAYIKDRGITDKDLLETIGGPDFPTGGLVINQDELLKGYKTGRGRIRIRGKYKLETRGKKELMVFYEIPYMTKKTKIIEDIVKLAENKEVEGISDVRDESAREMALVVELSKGYSAEKVAGQLFSKTQLENTYSLNNTCLVDGQPKTLSFKELVKHYVEFQREIITRRTQFDLNKVLDRIEIIEGLILALADIDKVISIIRGSDSTIIARDSLLKNFELNERQAKSVLAMRLSSLTRLEVQELKNEKSGLEKKKVRFNEILNSTSVLDELLLTELKSIAKRYIVPQRTEITQISEEKLEKEKVAAKVEDVNISINSDSIVTFVSKRRFKTKANKEDSVYQIETDTGEDLIVFMSDGKVYRLPVADINSGDSLITLLEADEDKQIVDVLTDTEKDYIIFLTEQGMLKKTKISEYDNIRRTGIIGIRLKEDDRVVAIEYINEDPVIILSNVGKTIHFNTDEITPIGRNSLGVIAMKLDKGEKAVGMAVNSQDTTHYLTATREGYVKKTAISEYPKQNRNGKGVIGLKKEDYDEALDILSVNDNDKIIIYGATRLVKNSVKDVPLVNRTSMGNKMAKEGQVQNVRVI